MHLPLSVFYNLLLNSPDVVGLFLVIALEHLFHLTAIKAVLLNTHHLRLVTRQFNC